MGSPRLPPFYSSFLECFLHYLLGKSRVSYDELAPSRHTLHLNCGGSSHRLRQTDHPQDMFPHVLHFSPLRFILAAALLSSRGL